MVAFSAFEPANVVQQTRTGQQELVVLAQPVKRLELFKKGDPRRFCEKQVTWKNLLPQIMVTVFPLIGGAYLLWTSFEWLILGLMLVPVIIWFLGNPLVYGKLACPHCRQGRICCPANDFFGKKVEK